MLSKKTRYAFRALTLLAENYGKGPVLICNISEQKNIPLKFLENILNELKKANLLESKKGKGGGYYLKVSPKKINLAPRQTNLCPGCFDPGPDNESARATKAREASDLPLYLA